MMSCLIRFLAFGCFLWSSQVVYAQTAPKKELRATRSNETIKIDGLALEPDWVSAQIATDFIEIDPVAGQKSPYTTKVRVLYDDVALYVLAEMKQPRDSTTVLYNLRDRNRNVDEFTVALNGFLDGTNGYGFAVSSAGVQADAKFTTDGSDLEEDPAWDAVWNVATQVNDDGWVAEFQIPYSAIRFPGGLEEQTWIINFVRFHTVARNESSWNAIDPAVPGFFNQCGLLKGLVGVKPPPRIQALPFLAASVQNYYDKAATTPSQTGRQFNGGMDLKIGLTDAFTLDMTLIPDFGQVRFDNRILNLSPFEVRFDENRPFFTEGAEIFNKGGLFYSRRVGATPLNYLNVYNNLSPDETIIDNPANEQLYNATKLSGRTSKNTGIGFFNAVAAPTFAQISKTNGSSRKVQTSPLTNYNVLVLDQTLRNNSNLYLINTSVLRQGSEYDAIATGAGTTLRDKKNNWALDANGKISQKINSDSIDRGYAYNVELSRTGGPYTGGVFHYVESYNYDPNDLGFLMSPNENATGAFVKYSIFKPYKIWNDISIDAWSFYGRTQKPNAFSSLEMGFNTFFLTKKIVAYGIEVEGSPRTSFDYFEPRTADFSQFLTRPAFIDFGGFVSTDYRKPFALDVSANIVYRDKYGNRENSITVAPRFRPNSKLFFVLRAEIERQFNDFGYVFSNSEAVGYSNLAAESINVGFRDFNVITGGVDGQYTFNNKMGLTLRLRHYWAQVEYNTFETLRTDGSTLYQGYSGIDPAGNDLHSTNFNIFNIDLVYQWRFAPGSDLFLTWKNSALNGDSDIRSTYYRNVIDLASLPQSNSLQLKMIYFLDYSVLKARLNSSKAD